MLTALRRLRCGSRQRCTAPTWHCPAAGCLHKPPQDMPPARPRPACTTRGIPVHRRSHRAMPRHSHTCTVPMVDNLQVCTQQHSLAIWHTACQAGPCIRGGCPRHPPPPAPSCTAAAAVGDHNPENLQRLHLHKCHRHCRVGRLIPQGGVFTSDSQPTLCLAGGGTGQAPCSRPNSEH